MTNTNRSALKLHTAAGRTVRLTNRAIEVSRWAGSSVDADIDTIAAQLLALSVRDDESISEVRGAFELECLDGAEDADTIAAWGEYAGAIVDYAVAHPAAS